MGITEILRRIWLFSANKIESESFSKQPTQLIIAAHNCHTYFRLVFSVTCVIMQRNGAGLEMASSCYWDGKLDGSFTYKYENKTMYIIVNVFGLSI